MLIHFCSPPYADIVAKYQKIFSTLFAQIVLIYVPFIASFAFVLQKASGKAHTPKVALWRI
jgi:hypothetical protein